MTRAARSGSVFCGLGVVAVALAFLGLLVFGQGASISGEITAREKAVTAAAADLTAAHTRITTTAMHEIAPDSSATLALRQVVADTVSGRYDRTPADPNGPDRLYAALDAAAPDLTASPTAYAATQRVLLAARSEFALTQGSLAAQVAQYDDEIAPDNSLRAWVITTAGHPGPALIAVRDGRPVHGADALDVIRRQAQPAAAAPSTGTP